jgi:EAL domain-containing protein (putative c-di-GMP-specific phosphodiesterase class I)
VAEFIKTIRIRYQPVIRLEDLHPVGVEVLVRTIGPNGQLNGPESVVEAMTGTEESMTLTRMIVQRAFAEYAAEGFETLGLTFAFNLPLDAMLHPDLLSIIEAIRAKAFVPAAAFGFELTERHPVHDTARVGAVITTLRDAGYPIALDDITPGTTNLDALLRMPIKAFKLDRSITNSKRRSDLDFIRRIVAHTGANKQVVIAEGIETFSTLQKIRGLGVPYGQGFLFARPLRAGALKPFLTGWANREAALA